MRSYGWPLEVEDRIHHGVAQHTVGRPRVAAQHTVLFGAQSGDRLAGLVVEPVGAEFDGGAAERFEGMPVQQQLAVRVAPAAGTLALSSAESVMVRPFRVHPLRLLKAFGASL